MRIPLALSLLFMFLLILPASAQATLTITTYYPAPFGIYEEMRIHGRMSVGDPNNDGLFDVYPPTSPGASAAGQKRRP